MFKSFPYYQQLNAMDCGFTCLRMISKYYKRDISKTYLRQYLNVNREGVSLRALSDAADRIGFRTLAAKMTFDNFAAHAPLPCIAHFDLTHFVVVYKISGNKVYIADPDKGTYTYTKQEFLEHWQTNSETEEGVLLLFETSPEFYSKEESEFNGDHKKISFRYFLGYILPYRRYLIQLFIGLLVGTLIQLTVPFLTQSVVDIGINNQNIDFVYLVLAAQLMLFLSSTSVEFIRSWILLHMGTRINIAILSDFFIKLMKLPVSFFDRKMTGDILQRIGDHSRIESFLTGVTLNTLFSFVTLIVFGVVLAYYSIALFVIFLIGSAVYIAWILMFLKIRKRLDNERFAKSAVAQEKTLELLLAMQEIKIQNCEKKKRWEWEAVQARLFKLSIKSLGYGQFESSGALFINELKNIFVSFFAAKLVIEGELTFGMMLSSQYIIGQLNGPVSALIGFIHTGQDAKISLDRLSEIHNEKEEDNGIQRNSDVPTSADIVFEDVSFRYGDKDSPEVLKGINLTIPAGKVTAIVGTSGSGKTTLFKLLLKFYGVNKGNIRIGQQDLENLDYKAWRAACGIVMQESYIFSDTILENIAISEEDTDLVDKERLRYAAEISNSREVIEALPLGYNTRLGPNGVGLSEGQKQRLLLARVIYKNPNYLLLDEATNSLDANNEKIIIENLNKFFVNKTVVVIAHRLSTVRHADQIVVLDKGAIVEVGTHDDLIQKRGSYFNLVKNQLELNA